MNVFLSFRLSDKDAVCKLIDTLKGSAPNITFISHEASHEEESKWKKSVEEKIESSEKVLFLLGQTAASSDAIKWELQLVLSKNKPFRIVGLNGKQHLPSYAISFQEHISSKDFKELNRFLLSSSRLIAPDELLVEQYKMMVSSTEKVTEQRLKTNNLFFTVTSTILSFSMLVGKEFEFNKIGLTLMIALATIALICTFFWKRMINSYGCLNTGKFKVISEIEDKIKTNLFQREWDVLINDIKYRSNTKTEIDIVNSYRWVITGGLALEISVLLFRHFKFEILCLKDFLFHLQ